MSLRNVQLLEIIQIVLHFRSFRNFVAHTHEDTLHLFQSNGIRMTMSHIRFLCRQGHIDHLSGKFSFAEFRLQFCLRRFQPCLNIDTGIIDQLSDFWPVFRRNILHSFQNCGQLTFFSKNIDTDIIQFVQRVRRFNIGNRMVQNRLKLFFDCSFTHRFLSPFSFFISARSIRTPCSRNKDFLNKKSLHPQRDETVVSRYHPDSRNHFRALMLRCNVRKTVIPTEAFRTTAPVRTSSGL